MARQRPDKGSIILHDFGRRRVRFRAKICALRAEAYADTQYGSGADVCLHKSEHALVAEVQSYRREIGGRYVDTFDSTAGIVFDMHPKSYSDTGVESHVLAVDIGKVHACGEADIVCAVVSCPALVVGACAQT